jgi:ABC-type multidrug transport system ATPase subunit
MSAELAIRLRGVVKRYGAITAVDHLDLDVPVGTCVGLLGPNGACCQTPTNGVRGA